ncbi:phage portal protein [Neobacillus sp. PS3-40]|uniref:phage portal protein n=1 Tax=Neobacillus sp. PS3-40 TaxID=3070679 RepID=UPI0027DFD8D2|nr:phage portal protein [Neobacillus sp. PS3-40]WML44080.1 phage portal protein [Neobacillus sp. PS3-40]
MITSEQIKASIKKHKAELPRLQKLFNNYVGQHKILNRTLPDPDKPNNKLVSDYPGVIIDTVLGYFASKPISVLSKSGNEKFLNDLQEIFYLNDEEDLNAEIVKDFSIFGKCYEVMWIDPEGSIRFTEFSPLEMYVETDTRGNIKFAFRYWDEKIDNATVTKVELYDETGIYYYVSSGNDFIPDPNEQSKIHYFGEVPVTVYKNNDEEIGDFEKFIPMIEGIDVLLSDSLNELESFANAFLKLKGYQGSTKEDILKLKQEGVLLLDDDGDADWLIKNINNQFQQNFFDTVDKLLHQQTSTPKLTSEEFASNLSSVAIRYKLFGLESKCAVKERKMTKALRKRLRLIATILNKKGNSYIVSDIRFQFSRNLPANEAEITDQIVKLWGKVDQETLLSWHPRIENPTQVIKKAKEEQDAMGLASLETILQQQKSGTVNG